MGWIPKIEITAGLLAGRSISTGSLQGLWDFPSASHQFSGNIAFSQRSDFANDNWEGAFGCSILEDLVSHARAALDGGGSLGEWYLLAEIPVPNPEGAQYYKQSYVIEVNDTSARYRENSRTYQDFTYTCKWFEGMWAFRVSRYQYDTPTSGYTRTDLSGSSNRGCGNGCVMIEQNHSDAVYYAFTGQWLWDKIYLSYGNFTNNSTNYFGVSMFGWRDKVPTYAEPHPTINNRRSFGLIGCNETYLNQIFGDFELPEKDDPNDDPNNPGNEEDGGDGDHDRPVVPIPVPDLPVVGAASAGFITMYKLAPADMWVFGQEFFVRSIFDAIKLLFANPMDVLIGVMMLPFIPEGSEMWYPKVGETYLTLHPLCKVSKQFYELDCGSIFINEYGRNCFDYSPYTQITIFLPYIGYRELPVDEIMGKNVGVVYHIDVLTGDCIAFVTTQVMGQGMGLPHTVVIAQFNGNCGIQVPAGSVSFDNLVSGAINFACSGMGVLASTALGGYDGGNVGQQISQLTSSTAGMITGMKPTVKRDGVIGSSSGWMSVLTPYIIRHIPNQSLPTGYCNYMGYPSNISGTLGSGFSGFAIVEDIQLNNIPAMETEREEIKELLREGVLL